MNIRSSAIGGILLLFSALYIFAAPPGDEKDPLEMDFSEIEESARGSELRFYMWGGNTLVNEWVDGPVAQKLRDTYDIDLVRVPMDAAVFVNRLLSEKEIGRQKGVMDVLWINGENFKNARQGGILYGPFTDALPNFAAYVDPSTAVSDAGFPVEGWEAPYGRAQFIVEYDSEEIPAPPDSFEALLQWVRENPGRFTYPQPPDFTGSAFIRQAFYHYSGGYQQFSAVFDRELFDEKVASLWDYLNALEPWLWRQGESYPPDIAILDGLFERGEVGFNMSFTQTAASSKIQQGRYPQSVRTFVFKGASLSNTHYLAIPFNAPNKAAALAGINEILGPELQLSKNDPANWGDFTVLDINRLPTKYAEAFANLDLGEATLPLSVLSENAIPEISSEYLEALERGWVENVLKK